VSLLRAARQALRACQGGSEASLGASPSIRVAGELQARRVQSPPNRGRSQRGQAREFESRGAES